MRTEIDLTASAESYPLVSCLCLTENRVHYLKRAIHCFMQQTYPNKELVLVCRATDQATLAYIDTLPAHLVRVKVLPANHGLKLGAIRNASIDAAQGTYICQWDDDDWYHNERIMLQYQAVKNSHQPATMLTNIVIYDIDNQQAYFSNFRLWENTLFAEKAALEDVRYQAGLQRHEDHEMMNDLLLQSQIVPTVSTYHYVYVVHGNNVSGQDHFTFLFGNSQPLPQFIADAVQQALDQGQPYEALCNLLNTPKYKAPLNYFYMRRQLVTEEREAALEAN